MNELKLCVITCIVIVFYIHLNLEYNNGNSSNDRERSYLNNKLFKIGFKLKKKKKIPNSQPHNKLQINLKTKHSFFF